VRDSVGCLGHGIDWGKGDFVGRAARGDLVSIVVVALWANRFAIRLRPAHLAERRIGRCFAVLVDRTKTNSCGMPLTEESAVPFCILSITYMMDIVRRGIAYNILYNDYDTFIYIGDTCRIKMNGKLELQIC
jgi:hypothetical protein